MTDAFVYGALRTGRGKAKPGGGLSGHTPVELLTSLLTALAERHHLPPGAIGDVVVGVATQTGEQGGDIARAAAVLAGWGTTTSGMTVNRFCSSGVDAIATAAGQVALGTSALVAAGGVESISRVPMYADAGPLFTDPALVERAGSVAMGVAADLIATLEGFDRAELDGYGLRTQQRAAQAWRDGRFAADLRPVPGPDGVPFAVDEAMRPATTAESLAQLAPAFAGVGAGGQDDLVRRHHPEVGELRHVHTLGTSPTLVDAAGLLLVGSAAAGAAHGLAPRARIVTAATASVDPVVMLTAGQEAAVAALDRAGLHPDDVAVFEIAEAFAATCLRFQRDLKVDDDRFNPGGGTIAMGHSFGATGAILAANCVGELERRGARFGVVAVSGAAGVGTAIVLERVP